MCIVDIIYSNDTMKENNINDIVLRLKTIFESNVYKNNLNNPMYNWIDVLIDEAINTLIEYIKKTNISVS